MGFLEFALKLLDVSCFKTGKQRSFLALGRKPALRAVTSTHQCQIRHVRNEYAVMPELDHATKVKSGSMYGCGVGVLAVEQDCVPENPERVASTV